MALFMARWELPGVYQPGALGGLGGEASTRNEGYPTEPTADDVAKAKMADSHLI